MRFGLFFGLRLIKVPHSYTQMKSSQLPMIDYLSILDMRAYIYIVLNCAIAATGISQPFRVTYLLFRLVINSTTGSGGMILS